jgi:dolichyl-phosphate beta-glucosyltransferase
VAEVAVNWTEVPGSKLNIVGATLSIAKDLLLVRVNYTLGRWRVCIPSALRASLAHGGLRSK